jgi:hypothetical protein
VLASTPLAVAINMATDSSGGWLAWGAVVALTLLVAILTHRVQQDSKPEERAAAARKRRANASALEHERLAVVFEARGWQSTLTELYDNNTLTRRFPLLSIAGEQFPISIFPAPQDEWDDVDSCLEQLRPQAVPSSLEYSRQYNPDAVPVREFQSLIRQLETRERFNGAAYLLEEMHFVDNRCRLIARPGWYFESLVTCEALDTELMRRLARRPSKKLRLENLPRRRWEHLATTHNVILDGRRRAAALSVSAVMIFPAASGGHRLLLARRSDAVAIPPLFYHVAPAGILSPLDADWRDWREEFSVWQTLSREYAEELFGYNSLERGLHEDGSRVAAHNLRHNPRIDALWAANKTGEVSVRYTGVSINLLTLRPEVHVLIMVHDRAWWECQIGLAKERDGKPLSFNWEWVQNDADRFLNLTDELDLSLWGSRTSHMAADQR